MTVRQRLGSTWNTTTGTHTVVATPAVGDLIVIICANTGITAAPTVTDNNSDGLGAYTQIVTANKGTNVDSMFLFIRNARVGSATSTTFSVTGASSTGGGATVWAVTGVGPVGASAARQSASQANQAAATPAPVFSSAVLTENILLGGVFNATNPATMTPPTNYIEELDTGFNSPATGIELVKRDSGETGTTITWGSASASAFCDLITELDTHLHAALAQTLGAVTISAAGQVIVKGALAVTLGAVTISATGTVANPSIHGTLAVSLGAVLESSAGQVIVKGALSKTLGAITDVSAGKVLVRASEATTLGAITDVSAGKVLIRASEATTLGAISEASTGKVVVKASEATTLGAITEASAGRVLVRANEATTLGAVTLAATGTVSSTAIIHASLAVTLAAIADSSAGQVLIRASEATTLGAFLLSAAGTVMTAQEGSVTTFDISVNTTLTQDVRVNFIQASDIQLNSVRCSVEYPTGNIVRLVSQFVNFLNQIADPTNIFLDVITPAGVTTTYQFGSSAIVKDSVGNYHFDIDTTGILGTFYYTWRATGTGQTADFRRRFVVEV